MKVYCISLKVHHGHFMGIFVLFIAFLFKIVVNECKLSDFHWFPVDSYCTSLKVRHRHFIGLFYRDYSVAVTRNC